MLTYIPPRTSPDTKSIPGGTHNDSNTKDALPVQGDSNEDSEGASTPQGDEHMEQTRVRYPKRNGTAPDLYQPGAASVPTADQNISPVPTTIEGAVSTGESNE